MVAVELAQRTVLLQGTAVEADPSSVEQCGSSPDLLPQSSFHVPLEKR